MKRKEEISFLNRIQSELEANLDNENYGIKALCGSLNLSRMHLHRKVKKITGKTTLQYIHFYRLERAKDLLQQSKLSISEVAYQTGFKSPSHFSQVFSRVIGISPSKWRRDIF